MNSSNLSRFASFGALALVTALVAGCPSRKVATVEPNQNLEQEKLVPVEINRDIDILFVVDNSGSMAEEQASLAANFSRFINVLQNIEGGLPNVHIGVVSTDVGAGNFGIMLCNGNGDNGDLQNIPQGVCDAPTGRYIIDLANPDGSRMTNYTGDLSDTFSCIARLGTQGCGFEQPLESMRRALDNNAINQGFLREDAFLAVIIISDEDDCSVSDTAMFDSSQTMVNDPLGPLGSFRCFEFGVTCEPSDPRVPGPRQNCVADDPDTNFMFDVQSYVDFLKGLKDDPNSVIVAGIFGNPTPVVVTTNDSGNPVLEPSCVSASGDADPGIRLKAFVDSFPQRNSFVTICNSDLSDALTNIANLLAKVIGSPCMDGNLSDVDPDTAGVQPDCTVTDRRWPGEEREEQTIIPKCSSEDNAVNEAPCWFASTDMTECPDTPTNLTITVERANQSVPSPTFTDIRCVATN